MALGRKTSGASTTRLSLLAALTLVWPYLSVQTKVPAILEGGTAYLTVYLGCGIFTIAQLVLERMLIATGKTLYSMISQVAGAVLNLIFDPIFIFGYFGALKLGITGAAMATVIGQCAATCIALALNLTKNREVRLRFTLHSPPMRSGKSVGSTAQMTLDGRADR